jgi:hypothetical protein
MEGLGNPSAYRSVVRGFGGDIPFFRTGFFFSHPNRTSHAF